VNLLSALFAVLLTVDAAPAAPPPPPASLPDVLARIDDLYKHRDDRAAWAEEQRLVQAALGRAPQDYGVLWRAARNYFWLSDDPGVPADQRSKWGKEGWDLAERAIAANPGDVAGYYFAAVNIGSYSLGLGVVKALAKGMEGKFRDRLGQAEKLNPRYMNDGIDTAWGRFYAKLPWPKRDRKKAEEYLQRANSQAPPNLRAGVYLAEVYLDDDRASDAKHVLDSVAAATTGRYDAPEERRAKALGAGLMPQVLAKIPK
jgi:hypothetical protein